MLLIFVELAEKMGVTPQYVSGIVRGTGSASIEVLSKIAHTLGVPLASLFADYKSGVEAKCPHCGKPLNIEIK